MNLDQLNALPAEQARAELLGCCGSTRWAERMSMQRPFADIDAMYAIADSVWRSLDRDDWLEAFAAHPKIGRRDSKPVPGVAAASSAGWAENEQAGTRDAGDTVLDALAEANREYENKFGFIYIVCATGKSGTQMLSLCRERLQNDLDAELRVAADEQAKITRLRLDKLLGVEATGGKA